MPVEYTVDSLDSVDESIRGAYVEADGKFNFDPDKYAEIKIQSSGLKKKNSDLINKEKALRESLKKFEPLGDFDEDQLTEFQTWRENKDKTPADGKHKPSEQLQADFDKFHNKEKSKWEAKEQELYATIAEKDKKLRHYELTVPIRDAAAKAGVLAEDMELVMLDVSGKFALDENGNGKIFMVDGDGDLTDVTPEKFFGTLYRQQRPKFYAASGASGSGAPSGTTAHGGAKVATRAQWEKMSSQESAKFFADGGKLVD